MFEKVDVFEKRYEELNVRLYDPEVASSADEYAAIMKELSEITPIVEKYGEYKNAAKTAEDAKQMLSSETDAEMRELLSEELKESESLAASVTPNSLPAITSIGSSSFTCLNISL